MQKYHLRRHDKEFKEQSALDRILRSTRYITLSMCMDDEPYLVTLNHGFDQERGCLYFHCAPKGKKLDILRANPRVWGMAVEDLGYLDGKCDHAYRSVMFGGSVFFLSEVEEKRRALEIMIHQQESDPEKVILEQLKPGAIRAVTIGRIDIEEMTGKEALD